MKTVGNDLVRNQLHADRKWYLILGFVLIIFGLVLFSSLPFAHFRLFSVWYFNDGGRCTAFNCCLKCI